MIRRVFDVVSTDADVIVEGVVIISTCAVPSIIDNWTLRTRGSELRYFSGNLDM